MLHVRQISACLDLRLSLDLTSNDPWDVDFFFFLMDLGSKNMYLAHRSVNKQ